MCQVKRELSSETSLYIISHNPEILQCVGYLLGGGGGELLYYSSIP